ncbi:ABC transporter ATP-binding protein [Pyrobaculum neutrophilum]|uniref:ABC transporter related n=1 Tax=Pyrobaculum neutrophilum (strain DSM 2338 / JCM 9278 / NBRC 100436 / V24Sta) TaxID=444157 RepID=B1Y913_PYRNV|nr:ATP-binding cassette domain-containing protein [Pyrobaculum neutrophilum]ACB40242.1 ABC transporter related [Pyrobaculum neutrophilum V24Sta]
MAFLKAVGIRKVFPGVVALDGVDFEVGRGEVHGLLGENGAGKSTLISILYGVYLPDGGAIYIDGRKTDIKSPRHAAELGIALISQHFALVDTLTVEENLKLSGVDVEKAVELGGRVGVELPLDKYVGELTVGEKQRVEIVKALARESKILLMDEPTALLGPREAKRLLETVRALASMGKAVVFVTHKIREAIEVADRITVLRRGRKVATYERPYDEETLLKAMFQGVVRRGSQRSRGAGEVVYRAVGIAGEKIRKADIEIRRGEVVAVVGVAGNGQEELMALLAGFKKPRAGRVYIEGVDLTGEPFHEFLRRGVAYLPEDRGYALAKELSVVDNFRIRCINRCVEKLMEAKEALDIDFPSPNARVAALSGGNQQKLLLARELWLREPYILVASYPTRGLDLETAEKFYALVRSRVRGGAVVSLEDVDEAVERADRIYVVSRGEVVAEFTPPFDLEEIAEAMTV